MRNLILRAGLGFLVLAGLAAAAAAREPVPLNDYTRLGQQFTATGSVSAIGVVVPSWSDDEGGLTLRLWDSPQRRQLLAQQAYTGVRDNATVELALPQPLPPSTYYWEISDRSGATRIGLYADRLDADAADCAYLDGSADPRRRFLFTVVPAAFRFADAQARLAALTGEAPLADRLQACRELAILGDRQAVPVLAGLLADPALSHAARYALEPLPEAAVDRAFRAALTTLAGRALVGVINSVAVRRDAKAVRPLAKLLDAADAEVATAAALALGRIGTGSAADVLAAVLPQAPEALRPALYDACLTCAQRLFEAGQERRAQVLYDRLLALETTGVIRSAAWRGAVVCRGKDGVPLLLEQLCGTDPALRATALWVIQHELPGPKVTLALAAGLPRLPPEARGALTEALCARADPKAQPAVLGLARAGDQAPRLAALRGLPRLGLDPATTAVLLAALADPDAEIAAAAQQALRGLPAGAADTELTALLGHAEAQTRLQAIQLLGTRQVTTAVPALLQTARDADPGVRQAALRALGDLAAQAAIPALLDLLAQAGRPEEAELAERAVRNACGRAAAPETCAALLAARLPEAAPGLRLALLRLLQAVGGKAAWETLLAASRDADPDRRAHAFRLLAEWKTPEAAPQLLQLAASAPDPNARLLCLRGGLRLANSKGLPPEQRLALCTQAAPLLQRADEKRLLLGVLGTLETAAALPLATPHLGDPATRAEAGAAVLAIAEKVRHGADAAKATAALQEVARTLPDTDVARRAEALLAPAK